MSNDGRGFCAFRMLVVLFNMQGLCFRIIVRSHDILSRRELSVFDRKHFLM